jgi:hypothetical protein
MTIYLAHTIVPARNKVASAKLLADLLGVPWAESGVGPFAPVYVNDGLTLDFIETNAGRIRCDPVTNQGMPMTVG